MDKDKEIKIEAPMEQVIELDMPSRDGDKH